MNNQERGPIVRVKRLRPQAQAPRRATTGASGFDLYACPEAESIEVGIDPVLVPTGIALEIPEGCDAQVRPRSGLMRQGVAVSLGTIDSDYRGEVLVTMFTFGNREPYTVRQGDRIAQLVVALLAPVAMVEVEELSESERGVSGHGSTGA